MGREEKTMGDEDLRRELRETERKVADLLARLGTEGGDAAAREELAAAVAQITRLRERLEREGRKVEPYAAAGALPTGATLSTFAPA